MPTPTRYLASQAFQSGSSAYSRILTRVSSWIWPRRCSSSRSSSLRTSGSSSLCSTTPQPAFVISVGNTPSGSPNVGLPCCCAMLFKSCALAWSIRSPLMMAAKVLRSIGSTRGAPVSASIPFTKTRSSCDGMGSLLSVRFLYVGRAGTRMDSRVRGNDGGAARLPDLGLSNCLIRSESSHAEAQRAQRRKKNARNPRLSLRLFASLCVFATLRELFKQSFRPSSRAGPRRRSRSMARPCRRCGQAGVGAIGPGWPGSAGPAHGRARPRRR